MDLLDRLLEHDRWATSQLLEVSRGLDDAQLDQEFDIGHRTLRETFGHTIVNVEFWTGLMTGQRPDEHAGDRSPAALGDWHERAYAAFADLARRMRDEGRLEETYVDHYDVRKTMGGTILHVVLHNAEHRTEAVHILARLGIPDVEVDHGLWDYELLNG